MGDRVFFIIVVLMFIIERFKIKYILIGWRVSFKIFLLGYRFDKMFVCLIKGWKVFDLNFFLIVIIIWVEFFFLKFSCLDICFLFEFYIILA